MTHLEKLTIKLEERKILEECLFEELDKGEQQNRLNFLEHQNNDIRKRIINMIPQFKQELIDAGVFPNVK